MRLLFLIIQPWMCWRNFDWIILSDNLGAYNAYLRWGLRNSIRTEEIIYIRYLHAEFLNDSAGDAKVNFLNIIIDVCVWYLCYNWIKIFVKGNRYYFCSLWWSSTNKYRERVDIMHNSFNGLKYEYHG